MKNILFVYQKNNMIVLWIDPWTTNVWYAIVKKDLNKKELLDFWIIQTEPKLSIEQKIVEICDDLLQIISKFEVNKIVIEKLFFQTNTKTAMDVAQARWAIVYVASLKNIIISSYTPLELKKAITWNWKASKKQLQKAIKIFFNLNSLPTPDDARDAIRLAYMGILEK